jgi:DNA-binding beta-propeller fold protein YncE
MRSLTNFPRLVGFAALAFPLALQIACSQDAKEAVPDTRTLTHVADIPMPGPAVRFDYQSLDAQNGRLYIAHMNADQLVVFDVRANKVVANLDGFKRVHGVIAIPEIGRVYASVTGDHVVAAVDMGSLKTLSAVGQIHYPDGLAYAPAIGRVFVSDEHGNADAVIDAKTNKLLSTITLGGGAGNTVWDPGSGRILVAVHEVNELDAIDPVTMQIVAHYQLPGVKDPHGIALDSASGLAFIAGEENHSLALFDLKSSKVLAVYQVGANPDVLAFDPGLKRLYVSAESGTVTVFQENGQALEQLDQFSMPRAHTVAVDPTTHLVYLPLESIGGHPLLRIMRPKSDR